LSRPRSALELDISARLRADRALALIPPRAVPGGEVADLGCATGSFSARLAALGATVVCVDVSADNLAALERRYPDLVASGRLLPVRADLTDLPLEAESVGAVYCMEVLAEVRDAAEPVEVTEPGFQLRLLLHRLRFLLVKRSVRRRISPAKRVPLAVRLPARLTPYAARDSSGEPPPVVAAFAPRARCKTVRGSSSRVSACASRGRRRGGARARRPSRPPSRPRRPRRRRGVRSRRGAGGAP
jgi:SAM-dependent methyltransferase